MAEAAVGTGPWRREKCYVLSWEAFGRSVERLAAAVRAGGDPVDAVLGIARGGLIPGAALANTLDIAAFHACSVRRNAGSGEYLEKREPHLEWMSARAGIAGARLLVVDDVSGTGATVDLVRRECLAAGALSVRVVSVVAMDGAQGFLDDVDHVLDDWVVFPWEAAPVGRALEAL